jgi:hypothetical protein
MHRVQSGEHAGTGKTRQRRELEAEAQQHVRCELGEVLLDRRQERGCDVVDAHRAAVQSRAREPQRATARRRTRGRKEPPVRRKRRVRPPLFVGAERDQPDVVTARCEAAKEHLERQAQAVDRGQGRLCCRDEDPQVGLCF